MTKPSLTPDFLRRSIAHDRELSAAASPAPWWHSHSTILRMHETERNGGEIVASMWVPKQQGYMGKTVDPTTELPNARFIVHARTALLRRDEAIEHLLAEVERLELELIEVRSAFDTLQTETTDAP
jgi:hypothetical protein